MLNTSLVDGGRATETSGFLFSVRLSNFRFESATDEQFHHSTDEEIKAKQNVEY